MNVLEWTMLLLAAMFGAFLFVTTGSLMFAMLMANVSDGLSRTDDDFRGERSE